MLFSWFRKSARSELPLEPPGPPSFLAARALHEEGRTSEAEALYRKALTEAPGHGASFHQIGLIRWQAGRLEDAVSMLSSAAAADGTVASYQRDLACVLGRLGRHAEAAAACEAAIRLNSGLPEPYHVIADALMARCRLLDAVAFEERALARKPDYTDAMYGLGKALNQLGRFPEAAAMLGRVSSVLLEAPEVHAHLAVAFNGAGRREECSAAFGSAMALVVGNAEALVGVGRILFAGDMPEEAEQCFRAALAKRPNDAAAQANLGLLAISRRDMAAANKHCRKALRQQANNPEARLCQVVIQLKTGQWDAGWKGFEQRWTGIGEASRPTYRQPVWRGAPAAGKTLYVYAEDGFGDTIHFCRFAPLAAQRGMRVVMAVQKPLVRLLSGLPDVEVIAQGDEPPPFDLHCPMLSLPIAFRTTVDTVPPAPYLKADAKLADKWQQSLPRSRGPRIGLAWSSNAANAPDRHRSIDPELLRPLFARTDAQFVNLQIGGKPAPRGLPMVNMMDSVCDFADTAAIIANLDLVISVDTAVAHLAGAMGRPVWLLNRFNPCWRWLMDQRDTPWYGSMCIYRQPAAGDWDPVVAEVARDLGGLATTTG